MKLYCIVRSNNGTWQMSDLKTERGYLNRLSSLTYKMDIEFIHCTPERYYSAKPYKTLTLN